MEKKCASCGKLFPKGKTISQKEWKKQTRYCSLKCYWEARRSGKYPSFWKNKNLSEATRKKISETNKRKGIEPKVKFVGSGSNNPTWKGEQASYFSIHNWVARHKIKPKNCNYCNKRLGDRFHWSNTNHLCSRNLDEYNAMHIKCHRAYDKKIRKRIKCN